MKKRFCILMAAVMVIGLIATGCGGSDKKEDSAGKKTEEKQEESTGEKVEGGSIVRAMPSDISSLNIVYETGDEGMTMLKPVYDPLFIVSKDEVRYYLAEKYEVSEDGKKITVKLRDGLKWHDGESITADDVIWNFEYKMVKENKASSGTTVNQQPVTVEKVDDLTFTVTLPEVSASYLATLGSIKLLPKHVYEGEANIASSELNMTQGVGSGPYKVKEWKKGESLTLEKFDDYYRDVNLDTVVFKIMPNESAQEIAFENGELNIMRVSTIEKYEKYAADDRYEMVTLDEGRINYMGFNSNSELMKNIDARKAIASALDVSAIVEGAYGSEDIAVPAKTVFCDQNFYYEDIDGYKQNLDEAKELIKSSGLEGKTLQLVYNSSRANMEDCALIIQQQLKEVGINVEVTGYETQGFFEKFFYTDAGDWDLGLNGYSTNGDNQGDEYMFSNQGFLSKNLCTTDEIADLWNQGDATTDTAKRAEIYAELQQQIKDAYTMVPISDCNFIMAVDKKLKGCDAINVVPVFEDYTQIYMTK